MEIKTQHCEHIVWLADSFFSPSLQNILQHFYFVSFFDDEIDAASCCGEDEATVSIWRA